MPVVVVEPEPPVVSVVDPPLDPPLVVVVVEPDPLSVVPVVTVPLEVTWVVIVVVMILPGMTYLAGRTGTNTT